MQLQFKEGSEEDAHQQARTDGMGREEEVEGGKGGVLFLAITLAWALIW
jgi:hypothetical protein